MKHFTNFVLFLALGLHGGASAQNAWGNVSLAPSSWDDVQNESIEPMYNDPIYDPGGSTCNYSQWAESREVNWGTVESLSALAACTWIGIRVAKTTVGQKIITTVTTKSGDLAKVGAVVAQGTCETLIETYVTGFDTRTCTRSFDNYSKKCTVVCGMWK